MRPSDHFFSQNYLFPFSSSDDISKVTHELEHIFLSGICLGFQILNLGDAHISTLRTKL